MGRCSEFVTKQYGFPCTTRQTAVVLGAAVPVQLLQNDPNRVAWTAINVGAAVGYLAFDSGVGAAYGIQLAAAGGNVGVNARDDGQMPSLELWGIGAGATTIYIVETLAVM